MNQSFKSRKLAVALALLLSMAAVAAVTKIDLATQVQNLLGLANGGLNADNSSGAKSGQAPVFNGTGFVASSPGIPDGNGGAAVTTTPYAVQCDSSTAILDRTTTVVLASGASVVNMPDSTGTGCGGNFPVVLINDGVTAGVTVNRGGADTLNVTDGLTHSDGQTSFTLADGQSAFLNNGTSTIWNVRLSARTALPAGSGIPQIASGSWGTTISPGTNAVAALGISDTTVAVSAGSQGGNSCSGATTFTMTGLTTSMVIHVGYSADPASLTGWGSTGGMVFHAWPSAVNTGSWEVCNQTGSSISYSSITFNISAR